MARRNAKAALRVLPVAVAAGLALAACGGGSTASDSSGGSTDAAYLADVKAQVEKYTAHTTKWDGPTSGPQAAKGKTIVYVSADQRNGGAFGVSKGVEEAAKALGWNVRVLDGQGTAAGAGSALDQAIALKPDGIVLGTVDTVQAKTQIDRANAAGITVVGWHSAPDPGPVASPKLFANITTKAEDVGKATALMAIHDSNGKAGAVLFTDSVYAIAIKKSDAMRDTLKQCGGCTVLETQDTPLSDTAARMQPLTSNLISKHGTKWTYGLGINDLYFDYSLAAARSAGKQPSGPLKFISAGDGSESAFQRIRNGQFQIGTVAEPLNLQGWECVDELNRAFGGQQWSGYTPGVHLVTKENIKFDGGPDNRYDPDNGYRDQYKKIWGVS
ncbi:substrate-binding domain-containing protein [Planosporangium flavigriseum]|uniref:Sugar ABC transporter substrate-binding protein n=1 Tax=Planosporangium flavigriseum TaxID=373681 RepID=A0A8J3LTU5_9ACTN|nr:substrate-binding domain-containing protein [Planosporangium flavigriseum]NJC67905.1 substrate-binding domain-containing protein [Planosporangium flavigriseum]GIG76438.1 sugar ABC transporter substrate-binding protein [Planosporangium flavigriseum]